MTMRATRKRKSVRARPCNAQVSNTAVSSKFKLPAKQEVLLRVKFYDNHYIGFEAVQYRFLGINLKKNVEHFVKEEKSYISYKKKSLECS